MKLSQIKPPATFKKDVPVPVAGGKSVKVAFEFIYRDKDAMVAWETERKERNAAADRASDRDVEWLMEMCSGWGFEEPFDREHVTELLKDHVGTAVAAYLVYVDELVKAREGN